MLLFILYLWCIAAVFGLIWALWLIWEILAWEYKWGDRWKE